MNVSIDNLKSSKMFILPILNVFEIYEIIIGKAFFHLETFDVLKLKNNKF